MMPSAQSQKCTMHSWTEPRFKSPLSCLGVAFRELLRQRAEVLHQATGFKTTLTVDMDMADMDVADGDNEEEDHLAHTDHRLWTGLHVTDLHRAECRPTVANGHAEEAVVVGAEDGEDVRGHIHDPEAARHGGAFLALLTADHHREPHQDEATAGEIAHRGEPVLAVEVVQAEEGEALAIAPMAATAVGVGTGDDCHSSSCCGMLRREGKRSRTCIVWD